MIAAGDHVGAGIDEILIDRLGDAEPAGGVLAIDGDKIELPVAHEARQALQHHRAATAADDVANKENAHASGRPAVDDLALG